MRAVRPFPSLAHPLPRAVTARASMVGAAGALVLLALILWWPLVVGARALYFGDLGLYFIPLLAFQRTELLAGRIPLWNPHLLCGTPLVGNPQAWPLYPSSVLLYLLPAHRAVGVIGVLHVAGAAVGTLLFLRRRGLGTAAALFGALVFAFGGALVSKMQFPNMVQAGAFLPWLLWAADGTIARPSAGRTILLAAVIGLALLAAHAQMFLMQLYLGAAWAIWRLSTVPERRRKSPVRALLAALALGGLLAAAELLPVLDMARASVRAGMTLQKANRFVLPPETLLTAFVWPDFYGNPARGDYTGRGNFWEPCAYAGILPFALALGAIWKRFRPLPMGEVRFWTVTSLLALWLSLGKIGGLYVLAFYGLPGVSKFHDPARWLHLTTFGLACLSAWGLDALLAPFSPSRRVLLAGAALGFTALDLLPFTRALNPTVDARVFAAPPASVRLLRARRAGRLFHINNDVVWARFATYRSYLPGGAANVEAFLDALAPNLPTLYGLSGADGYEPVRRSESGRLLDALRKRATRAANGKKSSPDLLPLLRAVGVTHIVTLRNERLQPVSDAAPRAALWGAWHAAPTAAGARTRFLSSNRDAVPLVTGIPSSSEPVFAARPVPLVIERDEPDRIVIAVPGGGGERLLVLLDSGHPGWTARGEDGAELPILPVNGLFRGVRLGPQVGGRVEFRYAPASWTVGLYLSLFGLGIVAGTATFHLRNKGKFTGDVERYPHPPEGA